MSKLLFQCMTKATTAKGNQFRIGIPWAFSRRAFLKVFDDHLECGDWRIDYTSINDATLFAYRSVFYIPGYVLRINTDEKTYNFGVNGWKYWEGELPFPVRRDKGRVASRLFILVARGFILTYLAIILWNYFH